MESKKRVITDFAGKSKKVGCLSCAIQNGEVDLHGGDIIETKYFGAHQDFEIPISGFIILASKRHIKSIDEFTKEEQKDFMSVMIKIRFGMRKALGIDCVCLIQEEDTSHHFHVWIFPRYKWMEEQFGKKIQSVRPIMEYARKELKTENNIEEVVEKTNILKKYLEN